MESRRIFKAAWTCSDRGKCQYSTRRNVSSSEGSRYSTHHLQAKPHRRVSWLTNGHKDTSCEGCLQMYPRLEQRPPAVALGVAASASRPTIANRDTQALTECQRQETPEPRFHDNASKDVKLEKSERSIATPRNSAGHQQEGEVERKEQAERNAGMGHLSPELHFADSPVYTYMRKCTRQTQELYRIRSEKPLDFLYLC